MFRNNLFSDFQFEHLEFLLAAVEDVFNMLVVHSEKHTVEHLDWFFV